MSYIYIKRRIWKKKKREEEFVNDDIRYITEEISKQSVEGTTWLILVAFSKIQEERDKLIKVLLSKQN